MERTGRHHLGFLLLGAVATAGCPLFSDELPCKYDDNCPPGQRCDQAQQRCIVGSRHADAGAVDRLSEGTDRGAVDLGADGAMHDARQPDTTAQDAAGRDLAVPDRALLDTLATDRAGSDRAGDDRGPPADAAGTGDGSCVGVPSSIALTCNDTGASSSCLISLGGATSSQAPCLACSAVLGKAVVHHTTFGEDPESCSLGDWSLITDPGACRDGVSGCAQSGGAQGCCDDLSELLVQDPDCALRADKAPCSAGHEEEWRLRAVLDLRELVAPELCFDLKTATVNASDGILVLVTDRGNRGGPESPEQIFCHTGAVAGDSAYHQLCSPLPAWADDNSGVEIVLVLHSEADNHSLYLDNLLVQGYWGPEACTERVVPLPGPLEGCSVSGDELSLDGWTVSYETGASTVFGCATDWVPESCRGAVAATAASGYLTLERDVDTSQIDSDLELCFAFGGIAEGGNEYMRVEYNASGEWLQLLEHLGDVSSDRACRAECFQLSSRDSATLRNPRLGLRFKFGGDNKTMGLAWVSLEGLHRCDDQDTAHLSVASVTEVAGGSGQYMTTISADTAGSANPPLRLQVEVACWPTTADLEARQSVELGFD